MQPSMEPHKDTHTMALAKDKAKLAVAAVKGEETQDLYVAVTKATLPDEVVPKEKHVRTLRIACSAHSPRHIVEYVVYKLGKRLANPSWLVVLKALMTFHRLLRECDASFQEQLLRYADRTGRHHMLALDRFADHTSKEAWDYSAWVRVYSSYLDERLDVYRTMRFDPEGNVSTAAQMQQQQQQQQAGGYANGTAAAAAPYGGPTGGPGVYGGPTGGPGVYGGPTGAYGNSPYGGPTGANGYGAYPAAGATGAAAAAPPAAGIKLKDCSAADLLQHLPKMQRLMGRMLMCIPEGASAVHPVILTSCSWVLKESRAVYKAASEGVMNLADKYFEMERAQALQGIELYKDNLALCERLNTYYAAMQNLPALRNIIQYPHLAPLPADFLTAMEEYVREAPKAVDPNSQSPRRAGAGPLAGNRVSSMAARGGSTSSAFAGGSVSLSPPPGELRAPGSPSSPQKQQEPEPEQQQEQAPPPRMPEIDLLSFDDEPSTSAAAAAPAAAPSAKGELDFLADGMDNAAQQQADGFGEPAAFGADGPANGVPQGQNPYGMYQPGPYGAPPGAYPGPYAGPTGAYPGAYAGPTGMMDPYGNPFMMGGPYAGPTGAQSMAIVPVGPVVGGMNMAMVPYGMGPFGGAAAGPTGAANPFNPFLAVPPPAAPVQQGPVRLENDPLNALTDELLGPPRSKLEDQAHKPSLNEIKQARTSQRMIPE